MCNITPNCFIRTFLTGLFMSAGLFVIEYFSIAFMFKLMPESIYILLALTLLSFLMFWMFIKYDSYIEMNDVFRKTISFNDFNLHNAGLAKLFIRYVRPMNPFIGILGTLSVIIFMFCAVPALFLYRMGLVESRLYILVVVISVGMSVLYLIVNREAYSAMLDKCIFLSGILFGILGTIYIFIY